MPVLLVSSNDHHFIAVNRTCDMGADSLLGHEIDFHMDGLPDLVFDLYKLDQAFWPGKPDQDVNIAATSGFSTGIETKDCDPLSALPGKNCRNISLFWEVPDLRQVWLSGAISHWEMTCNSTKRGGLCRRGG
jgi:hypothetical protein